jgi:hypothetical protein
MELSPIREGETLDPGIKDLVFYLREGGFDTITSCQGGRGHSFSMPTIRINPHGDMGEVEKRLAEWLTRGGYSGYYIKQINSYQTEPLPWIVGGELPTSFVEVEFWFWGYEESISAKAFRHLEELWQKLSLTHLP